MLYYCLLLQALECLLQLYEARSSYEEFCIPMCMLPATISNNVPGTDLSIGADTALNSIVEVRDKPPLRSHYFDDLSIEISLLDVLPLLQNITTFRCAMFRQYHTLHVM